MDIGDARRRCKKTLVITNMSETDTGASGALHVVCVISVRDNITRRKSETVFYISANTILTSKMS
jgi:hypothetical protein